MTPLLRALAVPFVFTALSAAAWAQAQKANPAYEPARGQEGKDVVWIPTPQAVVDKMLELAKVGPNDVVMDLGSGDGRTVITAAKKGARAMGIEYNAEMVEFARRNAAKEGVKVEFVKADLFKTDLSKATVITMFLLPDINLKLRPQILNLKPGTRIASNTFTMGDWEPDASFTVPENGGCVNSSWCTALLWIVPAKVAGTYKTAVGDVTLKQQYQKLSGTLTSGGRTVALEGKVTGEDVSFRAGGRTYRGRLNGTALELRAS